jgi:hypothetical protein
MGGPGLAPGLPDFTNKNGKNLPKWPQKWQMAIQDTKINTKLSWNSQTFQPRLSGKVVEWENKRKQKMPSKVYHN